MHLFMAFSKCKTVLLNTWITSILCRKTCVFSCWFISGRMAPSYKLFFFVLFMFRYLGGSWWDMLVDVLLCFPRQFVVPPCWFGKPAPSSGPLGPDGKPDCRGWLVLGCGVKFLNCNYSVVEVKLYTVSWNDEPSLACFNQKPCRCCVRCCWCTCFFFKRRE